jgi:hypothetical protein
MTATRLWPQNMFVIETVTSDYVCHQDSVLLPKNNVILMSRGGSRWNDGWSWNVEVEVERVTVEEKRSTRSHDDFGLWTDFEKFRLLEIYFANSVCVSIKSQNKSFFDQMLRLFDSSIGSHPPVSICHVDSTRLPIQVSESEMQPLLRVVRRQRFGSNKKRTRDGGEKRLPRKLMNYTQAVTTISG